MIASPNADVLVMAGYANGHRLASQFTSPTGIAIDANFDLFVSDRFEYRTADGKQYLHSIRKISSLTGEVTAVAGGYNGSAIARIATKYS